MVGLVVCQFLSTTDMISPNETDVVSNKSIKVALPCRFVIRMLVVTRDSGRFKKFEYKNHFGRGHHALRWFRSVTLGECSVTSFLLSVGLSPVFCTKKNRVENNFLPSFFLQEYWFPAQAKYSYFSADFRLENIACGFSVFKCI